MLTRYATDGAVAAANHLASSAGAGIMQRGGNAIDAVIAEAGVMAVVAPEACGFGGDLWAVIARTGELPVALIAAHDAPLTQLADPPHAPTSTGRRGDRPTRTLSFYADLTDSAYQVVCGRFFFCYGEDFEGRGLVVGAKN